MEDYGQSFLRIKVAISQVSSPLSQFFFGKKQRSSNFHVHRWRCFSSRSVAVKKFFSFHVFLLVQNVVVYS